MSTHFVSIGLFWWTSYLQIRSLTMINHPTDYPCLKCPSFINSYKHTTCHHKFNPSFSGKMVLKHRELFEFMKIEIGFQINVSFLMGSLKCLLDDSVMCSQLFCLLWQVTFPFSDSFLSIHYNSVSLSLSSTWAI